MRVVRAGHPSHTISEQLAYRVADTGALAHADPIGDADTYAYPDSDTDTHQYAETDRYADDRAPGGLPVSSELPGHRGTGIGQDRGAHLR